jgi:hypothetical protein
MAEDQDSVFLSHVTTIAIQKQGDRHQVAQQQHYWRTSQACVAEPC